MEMEYRCSAGNRATSRKRRRPGTGSTLEQIPCAWRRAALGWILAVAVSAPQGVSAFSSAKLPVMRASRPRESWSRMSRKGAATEVLVEAQSPSRTTQSPKKRNKGSSIKNKQNNKDLKDTDESNETSSVLVPGTLRRMARSSSSSSSSSSSGTLRSNQPPRRLLARSRASSKEDARENMEREDIASTYRIVEERLEWLEWELLQRDLGPEDFSDIRKGVYLAAAGDPDLMDGILSFLDVLLRLDHRSPSEANSRAYRLTWSSDSGDDEDDGTSQGTFLFDKEVLLASILHYAECMAPKGSSIAVLPGMAPVPQLPPAGPKTLPSSTGGNPAAPALLEDWNPGEGSGTTSLRQRLEALYAQEDTLVDDDENDSISVFSFFGPRVLRLAEAASRIRRAEMLSEALLSRTTANPNTVQNLLVSVSGDDWRALAIRCAASLHRLEAVLDQSGRVRGGETAMTLVRRPQRFPNAQEPKRSRDVVAARSAIKVYAALSQRMGLQLLKTQLEARAFKILYPRQYKVAESLFDHRGDSMEAIAGYLRHRIFQLLKQDSSLLSQLEDLSVACRVKEPYSYWKKLLKQHGKRKRAGEGEQGLALARLSGDREEPVEVQDGVALRVVLKARRLDPEETPEETLARERILCYYVHGLLRSVYPETHPSRVKDYIRFPKPNGYQSLHHTSAIRKGEHEFPFEIQIRSTSMHQIAEFGVAAHWDYKQKSRTLPQAAKPVGSSPPLLLAADQEPALQELRSAAPTRPNDSSQYLRALERARQSLVRSTIFCFVTGSSVSELEHGQLLSLEAGARISDILADLQKAYADDQIIDRDSFTPWKNGHPAGWDEELESGDVLLFDQRLN